MKNILLILVLLLCTATAQAQTNDQEKGDSTATNSNPVDQQEEELNLMRMSVDNYVNMQLPPLHVLLENARQRSSQVNMFTAKREGEERELKTLRRSWLRYIKLNASVSYGTNDTSNEIYYANSPNSIIQNVSGTTQRWWNIGASVNLPLEEIFNRRNKVKQQQQRISSIQYEVESWYDNICLQIIDSYSRAVLNLSLLENAARSMVTAQAQCAAVTTDFINGRVDAQILSRQQNVENDAVRQYEQTRSELNKALLELEVYSKTPIISRTGEALPR